MFILKTVLVLLMFTLLDAKQVDDRMKMEERLFQFIDSENSTEILTQLLKSYDKYKRPYHTVKPLEIQLSLGISTINHISEENMEFQVILYFRQVWHDQRLAYANDNTSILLQGELVNRLWIPDTYIDNAKKSTVDKDTRYVTLMSNGTLFYSFRASITAMTTMYFRYYPMDVQSLKLKMTSYAHDTSKLSLTWRTAEIFNKEIAAFVIVKEQKLSKTLPYITGSFSTLTYEFTIRRRLGYFIMQFYFPCILSVFVSWIPFWMDRFEIGDRLSLGITTLLTEVFLSQYINSSMPRVSYIKAADEFLLVSFIFIFLALMESVVVYNVRKDVRKKRKETKLQKRSIVKGKENGSYLHQDIPATVVQAFHDNGSQVPNIADGHLPSDQQTADPCNNTNRFIAHRERDLGCCVDEVSRVVFPTIYAVFVLYYFGRYVLYNHS